MAALQPPTPEGSGATWEWQYNEYKNDRWYAVWRRTNADATLSWLIPGITLTEVEIDPADYGDAGINPTSIALYSEQNNWPGQVLEEMLRNFYAVTGDVGGMFGIDTTKPSVSVPGYTPPGGSTASISGTTPSIEEWLKGQFPNQRPVTPTSGITGAPAGPSVSAPNIDPVSAILGTTTGMLIVLAGLGVILLMRK